MANQTFGDLYISDCDNCGAGLVDWDWCEDDLVFRATCTCGCEYILEPTAGVIECDSPGEEQDDEDYED
jgi:hypothetical protein